MKQSQADTFDERFRKAAILLASLDDILAEQLLAEMPTAEAEQVRQALMQLEDVGSEEQDDVLAEFSRSRRRTSETTSGGVELDPSLLVRIEQSDSDIYGPQYETHQVGLNSLTDSEAETVVETLVREHPQTIALVISRLTHQAAGKIVSLLPMDLRDDVLGRVAELDPADESSTQIVEAHLSRWIREHRQRKHRIAAGSELVQKILENTSPLERSIIESRIHREQPRLAGILDGQVTRPRAINRMAPRTFKQKRYLPHPHVETNEINTATKHQDIDTDDPLQVLESVDDATLIAALTNVDTSIVTLALAGASETLMTRVLSQLPRRDAKRLGMQLRNIGPTRLSDMLGAQMQLARYVKDSQG